MIRETKEVLGCPFLRVSVLGQVDSRNGKALAEGKRRNNTMEKARVKQPKKSEGCIVRAQSVLVACRLKTQILN